MTSTDAAFAGSIPAIYDRDLGPWLFEGYAREVARRAKALAPRRVLETAAGTGIVTQALAEALPQAEIVATDLNEAMLKVLQARVATVAAQAADAQDLPFEDASFDLVICQFGVMFFPDRVKGNGEARRVLRDGGRYIAAIWDSLDTAEPAVRIARTASDAFPDDPPSFLSRVPWGYSDKARIESDMRAAGFESVKIETVQVSGTLDAKAAANGLCQGSPLRSEIEARDASRLQEITDAATRALADLDGKPTTLSAHIVTATR
ncbi:MAG TPA: methyltransferase domain-containing protein [Sphingomicrobium sp.]|jgi:SAM-dependent methyltransferase